MIWTIHDAYLISENGDELSHKVFYELVGHKLVLSLREKQQISIERMYGHLYITDFNFILFCNYKHKLNGKIYKCEYINSTNNVTLTNLKNNLDISYSNNAKEFWIA
jgi:hypothetical protein